MLTSVFVTKLVDPRNHRYCFWVVQRHRVSVFCFSVIYTKMLTHLPYGYCSCRYWDGSRRQTGVSEAELEVRRPGDEPSTARQQHKHSNVPTQLTAPVSVPAVATAVYTINRWSALLRQARERERDPAQMTC